MKKIQLLILLLFFAFNMQAQTAEEWIEKGDSTSSPLLKIQYYSKAVITKPNLSTAYIKRGEALEMLGQYEAAIGEYTTAIKIQPDNVEAYYFRGLAKIAVDRKKSAIKDFSKAIQVNPRFSPAFAARAKVWSWIKKKYRSITRL
jgi:tetratricopeptide (TPR) repeat protein